MGSDFESQEVERRAVVRGRIRLRVVLPGNREVEALEASRKDFFVALEDPDELGLGQTFDIEASRDEHRFTCKVEVVRKEIHPRKGVALRIIYITPVADETLKVILQDA